MSGKATRSEMNFGSLVSNSGCNRLTQSLKNEKQVVTFASLSIGMFDAA